MGEGLRAIAANLKIKGRIQDDGSRPSVKITAKIGAASTENSGRNLNSLLNEADYALYQNRNERREKPPAADA